MVVKVVDKAINDLNNKGIKLSQEAIELQINRINAGRKAAKTKLKNKQKVDPYNNTKKNEIRDLIVSTIKKEKCNTILTLETEKFYLPKKLPKCDFYIAEFNKETYFKMIEKKPDNVFLHYGNVIQMSDLVFNFDVIYLDFCCNYTTAEPVILRLINKLDKAKIIGFTFCLRANKKELEDYKFDLIKKLENIFGGTTKLLYGKAYSTTSPMITVLFKRKIDITEEYKEGYFIKGAKIYEEELVKHAAKNIKKYFPFIWSTGQLFDYSAVSLYTKRGVAREIIDVLCLLAFEDSMFSFGLRKIEDWEKLRRYYEIILFHNLHRVFKRKLPLTIEMLGGNCISRFSDNFYINNIHFLNDIDLLLVKKAKYIKRCYVCKDKYKTTENKQVSWKNWKTIDVIKTKEDKQGVFIFDDKNYCYKCLNELDRNILKKVLKINFNKIPNYENSNIL